MRGMVVVMSLWTIWSAVPAQAREFTLGQAVERALSANPGLEAKVRALEKARMDVGVAQSHFWPRVSLVASTNELRNSGDVASLDDLSSHTDSYGLRLTLNLFSGYSQLNNLERSRIEVKIAEERHKQAELELCANVQLQFLQLLKARRDMDNVESSIVRLEMQLKAAKAFVKVGMAPYLNVLQNEVELSQARQERIQAVNSIRGIKAQLNQFLGLEPMEEVDYVGNLEDFPHSMTYSEEDAIRQAMTSRPDLQIAQKSVDSARARSRATAGRFFPQVDVTFDNMRFRRDYQEPRYKDYARGYTALGINMTWPLFEGGQTAFAYAGDKKYMQSLQKEYENACTAARTDIIKALMDISSAGELLRVARKGVAAAEEGYAMAVKRYNTNVSTITELLNAQNQLTRAGAGVSQALAEYQSARVRFYFYIGRKNPYLR